MTKQIIYPFLCIVVLINGTSCMKADRYHKYRTEFVGLFDTLTVITGYAKNEGEFEQYAEVIYERLADLHQKFDIYNTYEGLNNICTVNKNAGIAPVAVDPDIIGLLIKSKEAYTLTQGVVNIAMGSVLSIWHDYRTEALDDKNAAKLPPKDLLEKAADKTDINDLLIDEQNETVYLQIQGMSLDTGAIAKGYAAGLAAEEAQTAGLESAVINIGGNVVAIGKPMDAKREQWSVGIQDPEQDADGDSGILDVIYVNSTAVVTSGNYQRFFEVDGERYNHIIDPFTLMPADKYAAVTVVHPDPAVADILSTALFILPMDVGKKIAFTLQAGVMWVLSDGSIETTNDFRAIYQ